ncbi:MAG: hypothetical protein C0448_12550 [Sphingobacteriaceae bacterium]|nr:hypothetical protein [Sphingobacteriaceae bacterium]
MINILSKIYNVFFRDKGLPYPHLYSPFGIPREKIKNINSKIKLLIDPTPKYFGLKRAVDKLRYDKIILIHGCEPPELNNISTQIIKNASSFTKVYSFDFKVLNTIPNSELFCFGSCWISDENNYDNRFNTNKNFKLSFIKSSKNQLEGHKFRTNVVQLLNRNYSFEVLFPKQRIDSKESLFIDSMFHITIENVKCENYFSEKIIDCFMSYTLPIYWGCPNIDKYFDINGIIVINSISELEIVLANLKEEDYFYRLDSIKRNFEIAKEKYAFFFQRLNHIVDSVK